VRIQIRNPAEQNQIKFNRLYIVRKSPNDNKREEKSQFAEIMESVQRMLAQQQARTDQLLQRLVERSEKAPATDPLQLFMAAQQNATQMFAVIASAMGGGNKGGGVEQLTGMITAMRAIKGLGDDLAGGAPVRDEGLAGILRSVVPLAVPFAQSLANRPLGAPAVQRIAAPVAQPVPNPQAPAASAIGGGDTRAASATAAPSTSAQTAPTTDPTIAGLENAKMLAQLRQALGMMADAAGSNAPPDPKAAAGDLLTQLPEEFDGLIYETLSAEDWFQRLGFVQPKILGYQPWFAQVRDEILASYARAPATEGTAATDE